MFVGPFLLVLLEYSGWHLVTRRVTVPEAVTPILIAGRHKRTFARASHRRLVRATHAGQEVAGTRGPYGRALRREASAQDRKGPGDAWFGW